MKRLIHFFSICLIVTQFIACKKDVTTPSNALPVTAGNVAGNFSVSSFTGTGDQTSVFNGFTFTFKENGSIVATSGSDTFNGTWRFDDSNNSEIKISFSNAPLNELNGSWHIDDLTDDHMSLTDGGEHEDPNDDHPHDHSHLEFERD